MTAAMLEGDMLDRQIDAFTDSAHQKLMGVVGDIVLGRPADFQFADAATGMVGALMAALVQTCAAAMPEQEGQTETEHADMITAFLVDGLSEAVPVFLARDPEW